MIFRRKNSLAALVLFAISLCVAQSDHAQSGGTFQLEQTVIAAGGPSNGGTFTSTFAIGEPAGGGGMAGGRIQISTGFFALAPLLPTAAHVSVGGRIMTAGGRPIGGVRLSLLNSAGVVKTALTNQFGYFRFFGVPAGQTYILAATAKGYEFAAQVVTVDNEIADLNLNSLD